MLRSSKHADYQANLAMGLAKVLGRPPRDVATAILQKLPEGGWIERAEIAGPGFINLWISKARLTNKSIPAIKAMTSLRRLHLSNTGISSEGLMSIKSDMPFCEVTPVS